MYVVYLIDNVFQATLEEIKTAADPIIEKHFACEPTTFAVVVK